MTGGSWGVTQGTGGLGAGRLRWRTLTCELRAVEPFPKFPFSLSLFPLDLNTGPWLEWDETRQDRTEPQGGEKGGTGTGPFSLQAV